MTQVAAVPPGAGSGRLVPGLESPPALNLQVSRQTTMNDRHACGGMLRRQFLTASAGSLPLISTLAATATAGDESQARVASGATHVGAKEGAASKLGAPGLYPGKVVEARNPAMIRGGTRD